MSVASVPPPLPTAARPKKPAEAPSHAEFLLAQIRASLAQLHKGHALDAVTYRDVDSRLSKAVLKEPPPSREGNAGLEVSESDSEEVKLGKRNAWVRKTMAETDVLPNIVEAALNTVAGPFLSGTSIDIIVELVSQSQKTIAEAITDPKKQQVASTSAFVGLKEAHGGMARGISAANTSLAEMKQRMDQKRLQAEAKKQEKKERKEMQRELKEERNAIKEQIAAGVGQDRPDTHNSNDVPSVTAPRAEDTAASCPACGKPVGQIDGKVTDKATVWAQTQDEEEPTAVNVTSTSFGPSGSTVTTTFTALPDLRIVSTLLISGGPVTDNRGKATGPDAAEDMPTQNLGASMEHRELQPVDSPSSDARTLSRVRRDDRSGPSAFNADALDSQNTTRAIDRDDEVRDNEHPSRHTSISDHEAARDSARELTHPDAPRPTDERTPASARLAAPPVPASPARPAIRERSVSGPNRSDNSNRLLPTSGSEDAATGFGQVVDVTDKKRKGWKNRLLG